MIVDRHLQKRILEQAKAVYPGSFDAFTEMPDEAESDHFAKNTFYLFEHGLITEPGFICNNEPQIRDFAITAKGIDLLEDDGGLSAILNTITVHLAHDSLLQKLVEHIDASSGTNAEKSALREAVKTASDESLRTLTQRLVDLGIQSLPAAIQTLHAALRI